jgi:hypothetical protein
MDHTVTIAGGKWSYKCSMGRKRRYYAEMQEALAVPSDDIQGVFAARIAQTDAMFAFVTDCVRKVEGLKDASGKAYKSVQAAIEDLDEGDVMLLVGAIVNNQDDADGEPGNDSSGSASPQEHTTEAEK